MASGSGFGCDNARAAIRVWLYEDCTPEQRRELQRHLRDCPDCHRAFIAASAAQFFAQQDSRRDTAADSARISVDDVGLIAADATIPQEQLTPNAIPSVRDTSRRRA
ncbi:MAG: zf-HC2 domain-containing protein [Planctomycetales bacterium]|nr:zf-HC2 domain-containing protein [Planctomycetales bacterium]